MLPGITWIYGFMSRLTVIRLRRSILHGNLSKKQMPSPSRLNTKFTVEANWACPSPVPFIISRHCINLGKTYAKMDCYILLYNGTTIFVKNNPDSTGGEMSVDNAIDQFPLPPLAEGLPILGNTLAMRQDLGAFFLRQYKQLGSIFRARAFKQEFVVLAGAQANTFVSQQGAEIFRSPKVWKELGHELGNPYGILAIDGEPHTQLRKVLKPAYSAN